MRPTQGVLVGRERARLRLDTRTRWKCSVRPGARRSAWLEEGDMIRRKGLALAAALAVMLLAGRTFGQTATNGAIAGIVRDTTGAVLPGVTVEASSPALIEKVRSVVSDDQGNYKILELRPGTYTVTFTLPGFSVVKR